MAHPYHHALSSARLWGGTADDYLPLHAWFDESKMLTSDFRHRALRHHAEGIFMAVIWTRKHDLLALTKVVVPVVHRRRPAVRVARINAQAERTAGRCLWAHRGDHRATRASLILIDLLSEIAEELFNTPRDRAVTLDLARL